MSLLLLLSNFAFASDNPCNFLLSSPWNQNLNFTLVEKSLFNKYENLHLVPMNKFLVARGKHPSGSSNVYSVKLPNGTHAVFKPDETSWDPWFEVGAYRLAREIDLSIVPPTTMAEINGRLGSLILYVDSIFDLHTSREERDDLLAQLSPKNRSDIDVFHFVSGQWDRVSGNLIIDGSYEPALIDNEGLSSITWWELGRYPWRRIVELPPELRTGTDVREKKPFPYNEVQSFNQFEKQSLQEFKNKYHLREIKISALSNVRVKSEFHYVVWRDAIWKEAKSSLPIVTGDVLSQETLFKLVALTPERLRKILPAMFTDEHIAYILERRDMVLRKARTAQIIP